MTTTAFTTSALVRPALARHTLPATSPARPPAPAAPRPAPARAPRMELGKTVKQTLQDAAVYKTLFALAAAGGVDLDVSNCTVFPPTDAVFARQQPGLVDDLLSKPEAARAVVLRHVVPGLVLSSKHIGRSGVWDGVAGGPLSYESASGVVRVGGVAVNPQTCDNECDNGTIHPLTGVIPTPEYRRQGIAQYAVPQPPAAAPLAGVDKQRALGAAASVSTVGARKAMGLMKQQPFWMYGPPYGAAKQEEYEPISIAFPDVSSVDYQLMPPGSVVVVPDSTSAQEMLPVSGYSKYIGTTKRMVEGDGLSDYARLD